jgi:hypothetical protein
LLVLLSLGPAALADHRHLAVKAAAAEHLTPAMLLHQIQDRAAVAGRLLAHQDAAGLEAGPEHISTRL